MNKDDKLKLCSTCHDNFYNHRNGEHGTCFSFAGAKAVKRTRVGTWQNPPYRWQPESTLSCHHFGSGSHWIDRDDVRITVSRKDSK